jgi:hypothetical protein
LPRLSCRFTRIIVGIAFGSFADLYGNAFGFGQNFFGADLGLAGYLAVVCLSFQLLLGVIHDAHGLFLRIVQDFFPLLDNHLAWRTPQAWLSGCGLKDPAGGPLPPHLFSKGNFAALFNQFFEFVQGIQQIHFLYPPKIIYFLFFLSGAAPPAAALMRGPNLQKRLFPLRSWNL